MMSVPPCFDALVGRLSVGDPAAAALVFHRFAHRLVGLAAGRLHGLIRHRAAPEDVVQSVFRSFFTRQRDGQFDLASWEGLWDVLVVITLRKCCNRIEYFHAACRDVRREVPLDPATAGALVAGDGGAREPTPSEAMELAETVEQLLGRFQDRERAIVELSLQGCPVAEIGARLGCSERKVYRVRERIRLELQHMQAHTLSAPTA
jgi:RNA polymerase sigma-70 factor (ECF subfamily)